MKNIRSVSGALILGSLAATLGGSATSDGATLPGELEKVRQQIIDTCRANTTRDDNIPQMRAELDPLVNQLAVWFNANRPDDEVALTQRPWKSIWYDDPTIDEFANASFGPISISLNRDQVYQVVEDGFYYNVSESTISIFWIPLRKGRLLPFAFLPFRAQSFLKGAYSIIRPATPSNAGDAQLNTVDLEFVSNGIRIGRLQDGVDLRDLVNEVDAGGIGTIGVPGPIGQTGELWNLYVDQELRIAAGFEDVEPGTLDLYILLHAPTSGPLP